MPQTNAPTAPSVPVDALNEWLAYVDPDFVKRRDDILAALLRQVELYPTITDDGISEAFGLNRKMAATLIKDVEEFHERTKAPWLAGGRAVDDFKKELLKPLTPVLEATIRIMTDYLLDQERIARDRAERLAAEARREAEEAAAAAAEAMVKSRAPELAKAALAKAEETAKAAEKADRLAKGKAADLVRKRSPYGPTNTLTTTWGYEVTNFEEVRNGLKTISDAAVREVMKDRLPGGRPRAIEPGIRWVQIGKSTQTG